MPPPREAPPLECPEALGYNQSQASQIVAADDGSSAEKPLVSRLMQGHDIIQSPQEI